MKIEHLSERAADYTKSIEQVLEKKNEWALVTRPLLIKTLGAIAETYDIGWKVQQLSWMSASEAVNLVFDGLPSNLKEQTDQCATYEFIRGGALMFSQSESGDVYVFVVFPIAEVEFRDSSSVDMGCYAPKEITEKRIVEKVDQFLKEMINWEHPDEKARVGFRKQ